MRRKLATLGIILLVSINLAVLVTALCHRFMGHGDDARGGEFHQEMRSLHRRLGLSGEQDQRMRDLMERFQRETQPFGRGLQEKRSALMDLLENPQSDTTAIYTMQAKIDSLQIDFQRATLRHLITELSLLTPPQRKEFLSLLRQRLTREREHHHGEQDGLLEN